MRVVAWIALPLLIAALDLALLNGVVTDTLSVDVGGRGDQNMVSNAWDQELDDTGVSYRWTRARTGVGVHSPALLAGAALRVELGGGPTAETRPVVLSLDDSSRVAVLVAPEPRALQLLAPPSGVLQSGAQLLLAAPTVQVPGDARDLGIRLDRVVFSRWDGLGLPSPLVVLCQTILVLYGVLAMRRLRLGPPLVVVTGLAMLALGLWMVALDPPAATMWLLRSAGVALGGLAFAWFGAPLLDRLAPELGPPAASRWIYALTLASTFVRLIAVAYPPFGGHDLYIHSDRLGDVRIGVLELWDTPSEFGGRRSIVPSAYYVLASPLGLAVGDADLALQWLSALADGAGALLVALLARRLGAGPRAALVAALLVACLPIQFTALWWGFGPQVLGQWLLVLVAVLAADQRPLSRRRWLAAAVTLTIALLTHPGVVTLGGLWLAGVIVVAYASGRSRYALGWAGVLAASAAVAVALLYIDPLVAQVQSLGAASSGNPGMDEATRLRLLWEALYSSFRPLGRIGALAAGVALLWWTRGPSRVVAGAWIASALIFLLIDVATGLQVRYSYFALPMLAVGAGLLLDRLMRTRVGAAVSWAGLAVVAAAGLTLWYSGVIDSLKPTLTALTH